MQNSINFFFRDIRKTASLVNSRNWSEMTSGNYSILLDKYRLPFFSKMSKSPNCLIFPRSCPFLSRKTILISRSGSRFRDIINNPSNETIWLKVDEQGNAAQAFSRNNKNFSPSSEWWVHLLTQEKLLSSGIKHKAVLHAHTLYTNVLCRLYSSKGSREINQILSLAHDEFSYVFPEGIGIVSHLKPGSDQLAQETAKYFSATRQILIWPNHGCISVGDSLETAYDLMDALERISQIIVLSRG